MSRRAKIVMVVVLGSAFVSLGMLPLLYLTLPDPQPMSLRTLEDERVGTYVDATNGFSKMFPFTDQVTTFPPRVPTASAVTRVYVRYRQLDVLTAYSLHAFGSGEEVQVEKRVRSDKTLVMRPVTALPLGQYYAVAARDGVYGGSDYFYFLVGG
jgi:hypothetical protein